MNKKRILKLAIKHWKRTLFVVPVGMVLVTVGWFAYKLYKWTETVNGKLTKFAHKYL